MKSKYSESNMAGYEGLPSFPEFVDPTKTTANMNKYLLRDSGVGSRIGQNMGT